MNKESKEVSLDEATVGMELACDLADQHGTMLLPRGSILTGALLAALARRGIARVPVVGEPDGGALSDARRERIRARLAHLFRHGEEGARAELRTYLEYYRMEGT